MSDIKEATEVNKYARVAGFAYLAVILLGIFSVNLVATKLVVPGNIVATISNITTKGWLFRIGIASGGRSEFCVSLSG